MKNFLTIVIVLSHIFCAAQVYNREAVNLQKKQGKLTGKEKYRNPTGGTKNFKVNHINQTTSANSCNCWITRDSTFSVVPFDGSGGSGGPGVAPDYANDDWSTNAIHLAFNFCLYGTTFDS